jgi:hypothetical protein
VHCIVLIHVCVDGLGEARRAKRSRPAKLKQTLAHARSIRQASQTITTTLKVQNRAQTARFTHPAVDGSPWKGLPALCVGRSSICSCVATDMCWANRT